MRFCAEELGADLIFGWDHFHRPEVADLNQGIPVLADIQPDVANFEGWTALASWGEITQRAEIGLLVTGIGYRNPDLLADMARTVDHISGGRLILGLGAGWYEKDYTTYGYEFGTWKTRFDLFDDGLKRIEARFGELIPPPARKVPILIGGTGPKRTLPAVVRHADIWHTFLSVQGFTKASGQLNEMAAAAGRDGNDIERSVHWSGIESADAYHRAGASTFIAEIAPDPTTGYDLSPLKEMVAWRDRQH
jgi:probable F420-dependent oxidoreductase